MKLLKKIWEMDIKKQLLVMLSVIGIFGIFQQGVKHSLLQVLISIFTAAGLDFFLVVRYKKRFFPTIAVISGVIISLVLSPGVYWHIPVFASIFAIGSKYILRITGNFSSIFVLTIPKYDPSLLGLALTNLFVPIINHSRK